jgi:hypothetical protein
MPEGSKDGVGSEADLPPIPLSLEIQSIPDGHKEGVAAEPDISPTLSERFMEFIPDRIRRTMLGSTSTALVSSTETNPSEHSHDSDDVSPSPLELEITGSRSPRKTPKQTQIELPRPPVATRGGCW